jgi:hypothetical protein
VKRTLKYTAILIPTLLVSFFVFASWRGRARGDAYAKIQPGDSEVRVLELMGRPYAVVSSPPYIGWGHNPTALTPNTGQCFREFRFNNPWILGAETFQIGFDAKSNVVSNYSVSSP